MVAKVLIDNGPGLNVFTKRNVIRSQICLWKWAVSKFLVTMRIMDIAPLCTKEEIVEGHCKKKLCLLKNEPPLASSHSKLNFECYLCC